MDFSPFFWVDTITAEEEFLGIKEKYNSALVAAVSTVLLSWRLSAPETKPNPGPRDAVLYVWSAAEPLWIKHEGTSASGELQPSSREVHSIPPLTWSSCMRSRSLSDKVASSTLTIFIAFNDWRERQDQSLVSCFSMPILMKLYIFSSKLLFVCWANLLSCCAGFFFFLCSFTCT